MEVDWKIISFCFA